MGSITKRIDEEQRRWIARQRMFFVATAPLTEGGHVNLSPKGLDSFAVLDETTVAYADLIGSGAETIAHLRENGRITVMFCAFEGPPKILRLYGRGDVVLPAHPEFSTLRAGFAASLPSPRSVIRVHVTGIQTSCGYGVPRMTFDEERTQLVDWVGRKGEAGVRRYLREKNVRSLDGLPALDP
jgi:hypothetical protein